ncbi:uncharacterized protein LOC129766660 [Toxorhynchites rutilus septentrionalis]|uniref:uncharacterized protein LOC129766660 n=1 Tax=Toxorhynchites rutilus septentrionalis TaxID=329112 RepID=UPI0024797FAD|nr:uncharacterized protein LOC129766660 [Toxorhynchites rutilus septentrionalis]
MNYQLKLVLFASLLVLASSVDFSGETNNDYGEIVAKLIFEFITSYKRLKFGVVFTCSLANSERYLTFYDVIKGLMNDGNITVRAINVDGNGSDEGDDEGVLYASRMLEVVGHQQFVLLSLECRNADEVLRQASRYELFNSSFHWLIIDKQSNNNSNSSSLSTSAASVLLAASNPERWTRMYRLRTERSFRCREPVNQQDNCLLANSGKADSAVLGQDSNITYAYYNANDSDRRDDDDEDEFQRFAELNISINAEITFAIPTTASRQTFGLFDIWNPGYINGGHLNVTAMGNYTVKNYGGKRLNVRFRERTVVRRRNMNGLKLKIMTVVTQKPRESFETYLSTPKNTHMDSVHRYNFGLMSYLKEFYNFSFIMMRTKSWGYLRNGKFDGMIGALSRREVDLGGSPMFFRQERHRVVSYTTRSFKERPCFIFRHPRRQNTMENPFLLPFETIIWYLMMICGAILAMVLFTSLLFEDSVLVRGGRSARHAAKFDGSPPTGGPLNIEGDDDGETYYGDSFHFNRVIGRGWWHRRHREGTEKNVVLYNDAHRNNDDDSYCHLLRERRKWRKTSSRRRQLPHPTQLQQKQQRGALPGNDDATANDGTKNIHKTGKAGNATVNAQTVQHHSVRVGDAPKQESRESISTCSNYRPEKLSKSILLFLGGVCQQGLSEIPHLLSSRCISLSILIFGYLMFQYYSASIVGSLVMAPPRTIKTLRNLIDSHLTLGIEDIPYSRDYFVRTMDEESLELFRTRISFYNAKSGQNESHFSNAADGLRLVRGGGYAFHVAITAGYKIIRETFSEREVCDLAEIDMFPVSAQWMVAIVQKNSPYRDVITYGLRRLNEAGIMDHQRRVWQEPKPKCVRKIAPTDLIVGMNSVYSAFILLLGGLLLSVGLLLIEILHHKLGLGRNRQWQLRPRVGPRQDPELRFGNLPQQQWDHGPVYPYVD